MDGRRGPRRTEEGEDEIGALENDKDEGVDEGVRQQQMMCSFGVGLGCFRLFESWAVRERLTLGNIPRL